MNMELMLLSKENSLWDTHKVEYINNGSFLLKYNNKNVDIGLFVDFLSPEIIYDLIERFK